MYVYWAFEVRSTLKWSKSNLQTKGPRMNAIDFELNLAFWLKWDSAIREMCLKQDQGFNPRAAPPYPRICWVTPPPPSSRVRNIQEWLFENKINEHSLSSNSLDFNNTYAYMKYQHLWARIFGFLLQQRRRAQIQDINLFVTEEIASDNINIVISRYSFIGLARISSNLIGSLSWVI